MSNWNTEWAEVGVTEIDGVEVYRDKVHPGSAVYDLFHPALVYNGSTKQWEEAPRYRRLVALLHPSRPTVQKFQRGIAEYIERFGKKPHGGLICDTRDRFCMALMGDASVTEYEWPPCEWCGSTHAHDPLCLPTEVATVAGQAVHRVSLTEDERATLLTLAESDHDRRVSEILLRKLGG